MLNLFICDDNENQILSLKKKIQRITEENMLSIKMQQYFTNPKQLLKHLELNDNQYEGTSIFILDMDLNADMNGIDLATEIRRHDSRAYFVFLTAHSEYTKQSFKVKTFDYLLKPVNGFELENCLKAIQEDYNENSKAVENMSFISIKSGTSIYRIKVNDIIFIEKDQRIMITHTLSGNVYQSYDTLDELEKKLPGYFCRCHKSFIINLKRVEEVNISNDYVVMCTKHICYISKSAKQGLKEKIEQSVS